MKYATGLIMGAVLGAAGSVALINVMEPRLSRALMKRGKCMARAGMRKLSHMDLF